MSARAARKRITNISYDRLCTFDGFKNRRGAHSVDEVKKSLCVAGGHIAVIAANAYNPSVVLYRRQYSAAAIVASGRQNHHHLPKRLRVLWTFKNRRRGRYVPSAFARLMFRRTCRIQ